MTFSFKPPPHAVARAARTTAARMSRIMQAFYARTPRPALLTASALLIRVKLHLGSARAVLDDRRLGVVVSRTLAYRVTDLVPVEEHLHLRRRQLDEARGHAGDARRRGAAHEHDLVVAVGVDVGHAGDPRLAHVDVARDLVARDDGELELVPRVVLGAARAEADEVRVLGRPLARERALRGAVERRHGPLPLAVLLRLLVVG